MSCTGWTNLKQFFGIIFGIPKNYLKFSDLKPPLVMRRQKPAHFLSAQMALVSTFFQMFVVLGMYNFVENIKHATQKEKIWNKLPQSLRKAYPFTIA